MCNKNGHFITWPGIEDINFNTYINNLLLTTKGCLEQERSNLQCTQTDLNNNFETKDGIAVKTFENAAEIYQAKPKQTTYSDQIGRFAYRLSQGNEYIMVTYDFNSNAILAAPLKNRQA